MTVNEMFQAKGTIGGGCSESAVLRDAFHLIGTGESKCVTVDLNNDVAAEQGMVCGGQMKIFLTDLNEATETTTYLFAGFERNFLFDGCHCACADYGICGRRRKDEQHADNGNRIGAARQTDCDDDHNANHAVLRGFAEKIANLRWTAGRTWKASSGGASGRAQTAVRFCAHRSGRKPRPAAQSTGGT